MKSSVRKIVPGCFSRVFQEYIFALLTITFLFQTFFFLPNAIFSYFIFPSNKKQKNQRFSVACINRPKNRISVTHVSFCSWHFGNANLYAEKQISPRKERVIWMWASKCIVNAASEPLLSHFIYLSILYLILFQNKQDIQDRQNDCLDVCSIMNNLNEIFEGFYFFKQPIFNITIYTHKISFLFLISAMRNLKLTALLLS